MPSPHWITAALLPLLLASTAAHTDEPRSGYEFLMDETKTMQDDDFENPGMASVEQGSALFARTGKNGKTCASCHGEAGADLDTKRIARYPVYNHSQGMPLTLRNRIRNCWTDNLGNESLDYSQAEVIALESFVRHLARGERVNVDISGPMRTHYQAGERLFHTRFGQLDMACNHCHDDHAGRHLRGQLLSQGQSNGFPEYRLKTGRITGLHQRMKQCFVKFRARPFPAGSAELIDLEVYLTARGNGLKIETPAVRF